MIFLNKMKIIDKTTYQPCTLILYLFSKYYKALKRGILSINPTHVKYKNIAHNDAKRSRLSLDVCVHQTSI